MKKRVKIITTVASLCLAVALMAFGVYAATQVTLNISSNVSFTVEDVFVTITATAQLANDEPTQAQTWNYVSYTTNANGAKVAKDYGTAAVTGLTAWNVPMIEYTSQKRVVTYTITIQNDSFEDYIYVDVSGLRIPNIEGTYRTAGYGFGTNRVTTWNERFTMDVDDETIEIQNEGTWNENGVTWTPVDVIEVQPSYEEEINEDDTMRRSQLKIVITRTLEDVSHNIENWVDDDDNDATEDINIGFESLMGSIVIRKTPPTPAVGD